VVTITDVSPTRSNMSFGPGWQDVTGRMLSVASSDDGKLVFAGSLSSGLWVSEDGGQSWVQLAWEQPPPDQFGVPGALGGCCIPSVTVGPESARWRVDRNPRFLADITGDGNADIVGFGHTGVWTALSNGDGTFQPPRVVLADLCLEAGGWRVDRHPRLVADITGDGKADIVGFGDAGLWTALSNGDGTFKAPQFVLADLGSDQGWRVDRHPRLVADITGDGKADIVGFGDAGVYVALSKGDGTFELPMRFVLPNFGSGLTILAIARSDREVEDAGIWRSTNGGATWSLVHSFPRPGGLPPAAGQLVWALGTAHLVFAAGQTSLAVSRDGGATWQTATQQTGPIIGTGSPVPANHVAVGATPAGTLRPPAVYALASNMIQVSLDGGDTWIPDTGALPSPIGGAVGLSNSNNECVMVVSPRSPFEVFVTRDANAHPNLPQLWRGDFSGFAQTMTSTWQDVPIPQVGGQDSGNVWLAITRPGQGEALFYGPQRFFGDNVGEAWVAPLDPTSASDWQGLDATSKVHVDLHGLFLSPDFHAGFDGGRYMATAGTVWLLSDGGIDRSTDGGITFKPAGSISSLSTVNFAGASVAGRGPLLSLNTGDNDGFASRDGGQSWRSQQYGGGDNDTSWADPLRPHSMLIFTPRWDKTVTLYETQPGDLPDISSSSHRQVIPGPPLRPASTIWNASSGFAIRGFRPLIQSLPSDDPSLPMDCVFIRFFGNFSRDDPFARYPDHLAVLLRARDLRKIEKRTDWDTPGGWLTDRHPRVLAKITASGRADVVGFGDAGVWTALSKGGGLFADSQFVLADLGYEAGGWRVEKHPRFLADITGDGKADIVGFGDGGVWTALSNGDGSFAFTPQVVLEDFGHDQGWRVEQHLRFPADVTGEGRSDIVGFGDAGVLVSPALAGGTFRERPLFVIPNFGARASGHAEQVGPFLPDSSVGVVQASGGRERTVFYVGGNMSKRLWKWTEGMAAWQLLIPGGGANQAKRFFVSPYDPNLLYVIDGDHIRRSNDGGMTWQLDESLERMVTSDGRIPAGRDEFGDTTQVVLSDMQFDPFNAERRFAVGVAGAFMTTDGATWQRLLDTGAIRGLPTNCYFDWAAMPSDPSLYVGFAGRGIVRISELGLGGGVILRTAMPIAESEPAPLDRPTTRVRTADGQLGTAEVAPDERLFIALDDGRSVVVDDGDVTVLDDSSPI
jgi:hypothetical protein